MATKTKSPAKRKPARKAAASPKATAPKTKTVKSTARTRAAKTPGEAVVGTEQQVAKAALKMVDEAANLLRRGISTGASTSEKARLEAKQRAHSLLNDASSSLQSLLGSSASSLRKVINRM
ncbi:MAG: hypothetical protein SFU53_05285 [Terrimicrobiaceae bacterium]|nr:hypothetical protein [Terrimicrobiaceae bacterium]